MISFKQFLEESKKEVKSIYIKSDTNGSNGDLKLKLYVNDVVIFKKEIANKEINTKSKFKSELYDFLDFGLSSNGYGKELTIKNLVIDFDSSNSKYKVEL